MGYGLVFTAEPSDESESNELKMSQVADGKGAVNLPLISRHHPPHDETDSVFRRAQGHLVEHLPDDVWFYLHFLILGANAVETFVVTRDILLLNMFILWL